MSSNDNHKNVSQNKTTFFNSIPYSAKKQIKIYCRSCWGKTIANINKTNIKKLEKNESIYKWCDGCRKETEWRIDH